MKNTDLNERLDGRRASTSSHRETTHAVSFSGHSCTNLTSGSPVSCSDRGETGILKFLLRDQNFVVAVKEGTSINSFDWTMGKCAFWLQVFRLEAFSGQRAPADTSDPTEQGSAVNHFTSFL